jgi:Zn-dependent protease
MASSYEDLQDTIGEHAPGEESGVPVSVYPSHTPQTDEGEPRRGLIARVRAPFSTPAFATASSMVVSITAYSFVWNWKFALGLVAMLVGHESGHIIEARRQRIPIHPPDFVPFMGAVALMKEMPPNAWREAQVALAGPIAGSAAAASAWALSGAVHSDVLLDVAFVGFALNLLNLVPLVPLDGGRATVAVSPFSWVVGLGGLGALAYFVRNPVVITTVIIIAWLALRDLHYRWREREQLSEAGYYQTTVWQRMAVSIVYLGLAALLTLAAVASYSQNTI